MHPPGLKACVCVWLGRQRVRDAPVTHIRMFSEEFWIPADETLEYAYRILFRSFRCASIVFWPHRRLAPCVCHVVFTFRATQNGAKRRCAGAKEYDSSNSNDSKAFYQREKTRQTY